MNRPASIVMFDRLYLGSIVVALINVAVGWNTRQAVLRANPQMIANPEMAAMMGWFVPVVLVASFAISLLLWYLVSRRGSVVAKWFVVVFAGFGVLGSIGALFTLLTGRSPDVLSSVLGLVATALSVAAAVMLFRPDAQPWFTRAPDLQGTFE